ncbi:hypothetical protein [Streptomyces erythrochromogenes]|uniref:hypothetical protein n=1 Tax=Streptomyces erythrochromogenes TaxID=285574 RepID=UPI00367E6A9F
MELTYRRFDPSEASEADALVAFLTADTWPFHGAAVVGADQARRWIAGGRFDGDDTRTFWITDATTPSGSSASWTSATARPSSTCGFAPVTGGGASAAAPWAG